ncbi:hypothetical protein AB4562_03840 [Vibrio sp. 10N.222.54.A1]|uniref:hypothetical protein n=1 Tax=unclassified Vibrio TaxID=2614977 RepID=UPI0035517290
MKKTLLLIPLLCISTGLLAKVTYDDALESNQPFEEANAAVHNPPDTQGLSAGETPDGSASPQVVTFSTGAESTSIITKTLKPVNGWACSLSKVSGYYGRGLKGTTAEVFQSGGNWKLTSGRSSCGGCAVSASAVCWELAP